MTNGMNPGALEMEQTPSPARAGTVSGSPVIFTPQPPLPPVPIGGGRIIMNRDGDQTTITMTQLPPEIYRVMRRGEEVAFGLMGLLAVIVIGGPFARMIARRMEKRTEVAPTQQTQLMQQQMLQLQQSIDAMSIEVERISEGQRFQSKLLYEKKGE